MEVTRDEIFLVDRFRIAVAHIRQKTHFRRDYINARVILFEKFKIAYIPLPKCGNSSIRAAMLPLIGMNPSDVTAIQEFRGFVEIPLEKFLDRDDLQTWFIFCVVRDPYSRFASAYLDKLVTRPEVLRPLHRMGLRKGDGFKRYMKMLQAWPLSATNEHFAAQTFLLGKASNITHINFLKLEELINGWSFVRAEVKTRSGVHLANLERRNKTEAGLDWRSLYTPETRKIAYSLAAQDFIRFGYPK